jgi:hypothetical protein
VQALRAEPAVDALDNSINHKCQLFLALPGRLAEGAVTPDVLGYSWAGELLYVCLQIQIIPRVLQKVRRKGGAAVRVISE